MDNPLTTAIKQADSVEIFGALITVGEQDLKKLIDIKILIECILKKQGVANETYLQNKISTR